jgi:hypothetical protein
MIEIELSARERQLIRQWIDNVQRDSSVFGDDPIVFPDEVIVEHKLEKDGPVKFTRFHLELIVEWSETSPLPMVEEKRLIARIREALEQPARE